MRPAPRREASHGPRERPRAELASASRRPRAGRADGRRLRARPGAVPRVLRRPERAGRKGDDRGRLAVRPVAARGRRRRPITPGRREQHPPAAPHRGPALVRSPRLWRGAREEPCSARRVSRAAGGAAEPDRGGPSARSQGRATAVRADRRGLAAHPANGGHGEPAQPRDVRFGLTSAPFGARSWSTSTSPTSTTRGG